MEELLELKELLMGGNLADALLLVEEMTEMSKDDKLNKISSFAKILLLHLIKQQAEARTTRSWEASIDNAVFEIQKTNRRRKSGGTYLSVDELRETVDEAYPVALSGASAEAFGGCYTVKQLGAMVDRQVLIDRAIDLIVDNDIFNDRA